VATNYNANTFDCPKTITWEDDNKQTVTAVPSTLLCRRQSDLWRAINTLICRMT